MAPTTSLTRTAREYLRVSADKSGRLRSPEEQHDDNTQHAGREALTLGEPYRETGAVSASRYTDKIREAFATLLAGLDSGRFAADVLILWEPSRGSSRAPACSVNVPFLSNRGRGGGGSRRGWCGRAGLPGRAGSRHP